jgi:hypothetical protein
MTLWKIEIYDNKTDTDPSKVGYVEAAAEEDAVEITVSAMGDTLRAEVSCVKVKKIPGGSIIWVPDNIKGSLN